MNKSNMFTKAHNVVADLRCPLLGPIAPRQCFERFVKAKMQQPNKKNSFELNTKQKIWKCKTNPRSQKKERLQKKAEDFSQSPQKMQQKSKNVKKWGIKKWGEMPTPLRRSVSSITDGQRGHNSIIFTLFHNVY